MSETEKEIESLLNELTGSGINTISSNETISTSILLRVLKIVKDGVRAIF